MAGSIGFIGLGRMGRPMATNLLRKDFSALVGALCESRGAPPVRFAPERGRNR